MPHGNARHGMSKSPEYRAWHEMRRRCLNPSRHEYANYGGRGITVCERWSVFENFYADMGDRPDKEYSLDRIDNNAGYSPDNCRWATRAQQARNRRDNNTVTLNGRLLTVTEAAEITGVDRHTIARRLALGSNDDVACKKVRHGFAKNPDINITELARENGLPMNTLKVRLLRGWPLEEALAHPYGKRRTRATDRPPVGAVRVQCSAGDSRFYEVRR